MTPPEVLLAAARKAIPHVKWRIIKGSRSGRDEKVFGDGLRFHLDPYHGVVTAGYYCSLLQEALEKEGWEFGHYMNKFYAQNADKDQKIRFAYTKPDLLLTIVREGV